MINKGISTKDRIQEKVLSFFKSMEEEKNLSIPLLSKDEQKQALQLFNDVELMHSQQQQALNKDKQEGKGSPSSQPKQNTVSNLQLKIKSILKSGAIEKVISQQKKKVTFIDESSKEVVLIQGDRRWNQKLKDPRKGKFDPSERRLLIQSLSQCLREMNLSYQQTVKSFSDEDEKIPRNIHFWTKVCSILPNRSLPSSYKFLKRQLCEKNKGGQWKEDQVLVLQQLVKKYGTKWSMIAKEMNRTAENIRDKYRSLREQQSNPAIFQTIWKFEQLMNYLKYVEKYSKVDFLNQQIERQLQNAENHDQIEMKQLKQRKYNSKSFNFHNNETVRKYIGREFSSIKVQQVNWQKISDKLKNKTLFDCRNKFIQLLQLEIRGLGTKEQYQCEIVKFLQEQKPRHESEINWEAWASEEITKEQAKNRWMILKRHICGRGQKELGQVIKELRHKLLANQP